jgi:lipopolysaccharide export system permease protein
VTYKAYNDSMVFNADIWRTMFFKTAGVCAPTAYLWQEVVIDEPDYAQKLVLLRLNHAITD